jgi:hypothetical protein
MGFAENLAQHLRLAILVVQFGGKSGSGYQRKGRRNEAV